MWWVDYWESMWFVLVLEGSGLVKLFNFFFNPKYNEGMFESFKHEWHSLICFREWQAKERRLNIWNTLCGGNYYSHYDGKQVLTFLEVSELDLRARSISSLSPDSTPIIFTDSTLLIPFYHPLYLCLYLLIFNTSTVPTHCKDPDAGKD